MKFRNKNVLVYGLGKSGLGAIKLLLKKKAKVFVFDDNISALKNYFHKDVIKLENLTQNILKMFSFIVVNPCVSKYSENLKLAKLLNVKMISEIELAYFCAKEQVIGITGTNGKTTTSTLTYQILKNAGKKTKLVGNVGKSFCGEVCENKKGFFVCEVSSFQLETVKDFKSKIGCFLNFSENHLDRHFSLDEYFKTKLKIFNGKGIKILNYDDKNFENLRFENLYYFSKSKEVRGVFVKGGEIYFKDKKCEKVLNAGKIKLLGEHNLENVLCAVLICKLLKVKNEVIEKTVENFYGIEHRIEFVEEIKGVKFYNDSKSTTVESCLKALDCFASKKVLLIVGGSDKGFSFDKLFENIKDNVCEVICYGEVKDKILASASKFNFSNIISTSSFSNMVNLAKNLSLSGGYEIVLFSPATASFDMFKNFEERGKTFKKLVGEIKSEV